MVFSDHTHFLGIFILNNLYVCPFTVTKIVAKNHRLKMSFSQITFMEIIRINKTCPLFDLYEMCN